MTRPRLRIEWLPVSDDAAGLAAYVSERPIAPYAVLGVLRVTVDGDRSTLVVAKDSARAATQRTVAARPLLWRARKRQANGPAMAGPLKRHRGLLLMHGVIDPSRAA